MYATMERQFGNVANVLERMEQPIGNSVLERGAARIIYTIAVETFALLAVAYHTIYLTVKIIPSTVTYIVGRIIPELATKDTIWIEHGKPLVLALVILTAAVPTTLFKNFTPSKTLRHQMDWLSGRLPPPPTDYSNYTRIAFKVAKFAMYAGIATLYWRALGLRVPSWQTIRYLPQNFSCMLEGKEWVPDKW